MPVNLLRGDRKMHKALIVGLMGLLVSGCSVGIESFNEASERCKNNGGVSRLHWAGPGYLVAYCDNGAQFTIDGR